MLAVIDHLKLELVGINQNTISSHRYCIQTKRVRNSRVL